MAGRAAQNRLSRKPPSINQVLNSLKALANPRNVEGMARFGISSKNTLGINLPDLRIVARETGKDHALAEKLWASGIHEARILASMVDEADKVREEQMESWVKDFDSWDVCDNVCGSLFVKTPFAYQKAAEWSSRSEEFVKRAGFALMAYLAVHDKKAADEKFLNFLPFIAKESHDDRNFVKKAVNWALRQVGKRNLKLNAAAVKTARDIHQKGSRAGKWVASDALRELTDEKVLGKMRERGKQ